MVNDFLEHKAKKDGTVTPKRLAEANNILEITNRLTRIVKEIKKRLI